MFGKKFKIMSLWGFDIHIDPSWFLIAILITWSLASGWFPVHYADAGLGVDVYWAMGVFGALGLFFSIVFHEMAHSIVARQFGIPIRGITLFIFGGVAEMEGDPPDARSEWLMAAAGPLASLILGGFFYVVALVSDAAGWPVAVSGVLWYLALINTVLAVFNLVPAFPLDGGRMLRAMLWGWKGDIRRATRISSRLGDAFGLFLMVLGFIQFFRGNLIGGAWSFMIGLFVRGASESSYRQLLMKEALSGSSVGDFMNRHPITVEPSVTIQDLVESYFLHHHYKSFPVTLAGQLLGSISTREVKELGRELWPFRSVGDLMLGLSEESTVHADTPAIEALSDMSRRGTNRLLVVEDGRLVGLLSLNEMMRFLAVKFELEAEESTRPQTGPSTEN